MSAFEAGVKKILWVEPGLGNSVITVSMISVAFYDTRPYDQRYFDKALPAQVKMRNS